MPLSQKEATCLREAGGEGAKKEDPKDPGTSKL